MTDEKLINDLHTSKLKENQSLMIMESRGQTWKFVRVKCAILKIEPKRTQNVQETLRGDQNAKREWCNHGHWRMAIWRDLTVICKLESTISPPWNVFFGYFLSGGNLVILCTQFSRRFMDYMMIEFWSNKWEYILEAAGDVQENIKSMARVTRFWHDAADS